MAAAQLSRRAVPSFETTLLRVAQSTLACSVTLTPLRTMSRRVTNARRGVRALRCGTKPFQKHVVLGQTGDRFGPPGHCDSSEIACCLPSCSLGALVISGMLP